MGRDEAKMKAYWVPLGIVSMVLHYCELPDSPYRCIGFCDLKIGHSLRWDRRQIGIDRPAPSGLYSRLSERDSGRGRGFSDAEVFA